jgi:hypothetical protein
MFGVFIDIWSPGFPKDGFKCRLLLKFCRWLTLGDEYFRGDGGGDGGGNVTRLGRGRGFQQAEQGQQAQHQLHT